MKEVNKNFDENEIYEENKLILMKKMKYDSDGS